jgi:hypothetical protein
VGRYKLIKKLSSSITENIDLPIKIYSMEEAVKMGLVTNNNYFIYIIFAIIVIIAIVIWRVFKSRKRKANKGQ